MNNTRKYNSLQEEYAATHPVKNNNNGSNGEGDYLVSNICWIIFSILFVCAITGYLVHAVFVLLLIPVLFLLGWILKSLWTFK